LTAERPRTGNDEEIDRDDCKEQYPSDIEETTTGWPDDAEFLPMDPIDNEDIKEPWLSDLNGYGV